MQHIVIAEFMAESAVKNLAKEFTVDYLPDNDKQLASLINKANALIVRNKTMVDKRLLFQAKQLKVIGRLGVGLDNIDVDECFKKGIEVIPATGVNANAVAEYVINSAMTLLRQAYNVNAKIIAGKWPREDCIGNELSGKTIGLIGYGLIARKVAKKSIALGMDVVVYDPYVDPNDEALNDANHKTELNSLLAVADIVSLHVPLTQKTKNLINEDNIKSMKKNAILINTARGGIVDQRAVVKAIKNNQISGMALDTFDKEPVDSDDGSLFSNVPNIILTPHIAGITKESNEAVSNLISAKVSEFLQKNYEPV